MIELQLRTLAAEVVGVAERFAREPTLRVRPSVDARPNASSSQAAVVAIGLRRWRPQVRGSRARRQEGACEFASSAATSCDQFRQPRSLARRLACLYG
jgi:hypothetical protein